MSSFGDTLFYFDNEQVSSLFKLTRKQVPFEFLDRHWDRSESTFGRFRQARRGLEGINDREPTFEKVGYYRSSLRDFVDKAGMAMAFCGYRRLDPRLLSGNPPGWPSGNSTGVLRAVISEPWPAPSGRGNYAPSVDDTTRGVIGDCGSQRPRGHP